MPNPSAIFTKAQSLLSRHRKPWRYRWIAYYALPSLCYLDMGQEPPIRFSIVLVRERYA